MLFCNLFCLCIIVKEAQKKVILINLLIDLFNLSCMTNVNGHFWTCALTVQTSHYGYFCSTIKRPAESDIYNKMTLSALRYLTDGDAGEDVLQLGAVLSVLLYQVDSLL